MAAAASIKLGRNGFTKEAEFGWNKRNSPFDQELYMKIFNKEVKLQRP